MSDLRRVLSQWPKIDLHRHLEGSVRLDTLSQIALEHGLDTPGSELETIRPRVQMTEQPYNYRHFLSKFEALRSFFRTREIIERVAYEAVADAAADNIVYLELRFTPSALAQEGRFELEDVTQWVIKTVRRAEADHRIRVNLIMSINRHEPIPIGQRTAELASQYQGMIAGLDLSGDEAGFSARPFGPLFDQARKAGLGITAHAGEWRGPESIRETIKHLRVDRIGHGVRAVEDLEAVRQITARGITLEVCPTSNIQSGVVGSADRHPLKQLLDLGLPVTIGTDDPSVSGITLTDEYTLAVNELGLTLDDLKQVVLNAASAAFLPASERAALAKHVQRVLAAY